MKTFSFMLGVAAFAAANLVAAGFVAGLTTTALAADYPLSGTIASAAGEKLAGVTVSAKAQGTTNHHQRLHDGQGGYYFPPLPAGKYSVWAQALAFERALGEVDLTAAARKT